MFTLEWTLAIMRRLTMVLFWKAFYGVDSLGGISMKATTHKNSLSSPRGSQAAVNNYVIDIHVMILDPLCSRVVVTLMHEQYYMNSCCHPMD